MNNKLGLNYIIILVEVIMLNDITRWKLFSKSNLNVFIV